MSSKAGANAGRTAGKADAQTVGTETGTRDAPETIVTLGELVSVPGLPSEPTLRKLIDANPDFPLIARGRNGQGYEIPLERAIEWWKTYRAREEEAARQRGEDIRQLGLELLGADAAVAQGMEGLTPSEQRAALEAEIAAVKLGVMRGEFLRSADIESEIGALFVWLQQAITGLPDRVVKDMELTREQRVALSRVCTDILDELADRLEGIKRVDAPAEDPALQEGS